MVNQQFAFAVHILAVLAYSDGIVGSRIVAAIMECLARNVAGFRMWQQ